MSIYFPYIFRTIPLSFDDSMSYYEQLLAINKVLESYSTEIAKIETTINNLEDNILKSVKLELLNFSREVKEEIDLLKKETEKEINDFENSTNERITKLEDDVEKSIQNFQNELSIRFADMNKKIEEFITSTDLKIENFIASENMKFTNFTIEVDEKIHVLRNEFFDLLESIDEIYNYIDRQNDVYWNRLKDYCDEIYTKRNIYYVKNPIDGKIGEINSVLDLIYRITNHAVTCDEFNYIGLTVSEYNSLNYTCIEYLKKYKDLYWKKYYTESTSIQNPYTGRFENVVNVVKQLVKFHEEVNSLTASDYADLGLTATEYDTKNVTAYDYYVNGKKIFA